MASSQIYGLIVSFFSVQVLACSSGNTISDSSTKTPAPVPTKVEPLQNSTSEASLPTHEDTTLPTDSLILSPEKAAPFFTHGNFASAKKEFEKKNWSKAEELFTIALGQKSNASERTIGRAFLLLSYTQAKQKKWSDAATSLTTAGIRLPLLKDYILYHTARAKFFDHKFEMAQRFARKVSSSSIHGAEAHLLAGDILRRKHEWRAVEKHYRNYLKIHPRGMRQAEVHMRIAEALEKQNKKSSEFLPLYRKVTFSWPLSKWASQATARINAAISRMPRSDRHTQNETTANEFITRGMAYYRAQRNPLSAADFKAALGSPGLDAEMACVAAYHHANSWYKERKRKRAAPLFDVAYELCKNTDNTTLKVKSIYQAGRSYGRTKEELKATKRYAKLEKEFPRHSYADDARLRQAEEFRDLGMERKEEALLSNLPNLYPDGDMKAEAMWRLGWRAYKKKKYREALRWLKRQVTAKTVEDNYWAEGQAHYWLGRTYAKLGKKNKSIEAYRQAVLQYPLTYYALLALNRLRESHPRQFQSLLEEIEKVPRTYNPNEPTFRFKQRLVYGSDGFRRGLEFLRLGLGREAAKEFRNVDFRRPSGRKAVHDPDEIDKLWAMAFLYHHAGDHSNSHWVTRWHIVNYKRQWPTGHNETRWRIAYPLAFWPLFLEHATKHGYPPELQIAIAREESAFDPTLESYANAIGLTQIILPTARRFARGTSIKVNRRTLRIPENNVTIGGNFLGFLWKKWDKHIALIPPSYNAGEGATRRWLRARGHLAFDEWAEEIHIDQARRYSKRVMSSFFTYAYLRNRGIPKIPNVLPPELWR